jgi:hypothetical protein
MLARKLEKALRRRYRADGDPVLGSLAHQAARCAALAEALADEMLEGPSGARRRAQERYVAVTRNYRKAVDLLTTAASQTRKSPTLAEVIREHRRVTQGQADD